MPSVASFRAHFPRQPQWKKQEKPKGSAYWGFADGPHSMMAAELARGGMSTDLTARRSDAARAVGQGVKSGQRPDEAGGSASGATSNGVVPEKSRQRNVLRDSRLPAR